VPQQAGATTSEPGIQSPEAVVRLAYRAFARRDTGRLKHLCHDTLELRPVDALGLVGDTLHGFDSARDWVTEHGQRGYSVTVWLRTLRQVTDHDVLGVGVVAERGRGCAATVAWVWHVRDGLIDRVAGYPSEAAARRSLSCQS
jgi:ketosteroid isomerase-like protein